MLQGFTFPRITQKNQYAGTPMTVTVTAVDPNGNMVTGYTGAVASGRSPASATAASRPRRSRSSSGTWTGAVTMYRADETSINRGNVNLYA